MYRVFNGKGRNYVYFNNKKKATKYLQKLERKGIHTSMIELDDEYYPMASTVGYKAAEKPKINYDWVVTNMTTRTGFWYESIDKALEYSKELLEKGHNVYIKKNDNSEIPISATTTTVWPMKKKMKKCYEVGKGFKKEIVELTEEEECFLI